MYVCTYLYMYGYMCPCIYMVYNHIIMCVHMCVCFQRESQIEPSEPVWTKGVILIVLSCLAMIVAFPCGIIALLWSISVSYCKIHHLMYMNFEQPAIQLVRSYTSSCKYSLFIHSQANSYVAIQLQCILSHVHCILSQHLATQLVAICIIMRL